MVYNTAQLRGVRSDQRRCTCGRALQPLTLPEALELVRERAEAERWRADAGQIPAPGRIPPPDGEMPARAEA